VLVIADPASASGVTALILQAADDPLLEIIETTIAPPAILA
jgi:hypothetical protein